MKLGSKILICFLLFTTVAFCEGGEDDDTFIGASETDAFAISVVCDPLAMKNVKKMIFRHVSQIMTGASDVTFAGMQQIIAGYITVTKGQVTEITTVGTNFPWNLMIQSFVRVKISIIINKVRLITGSDKITVESYRTIGDDKLDPIMKEFEELFKVETPSAEFLEVAAHQTTLLLTDADFIKAPNPITGLQNALCAAFTSYFDPNFVNKQGVDAGAIEFLENFLNHFIGLNVDGFAMNAMCMSSEKYILKPGEGPFLSITEKQKIFVISILFQIEYAFVTKNTKFFIDINILRKIKTFYFINELWLKWIVDIKVVQGTYKKKLGETAVNMDIKETSKGYLYIHFIYLYLMYTKQVTATTSVNDIKALIVKQLWENPCWRTPTDPAGKECQVLLELLPPEKFTRYVVLMLVILDNAPTKDLITKIFVNNKSIFTRNFDVKYLDLQSEIATIAKSVITSLLYINFSTEVKNNLAEFEGEPLIPADKYIQIKTATDPTFLIYKATVTTAPGLKLNTYLPDYPETEGPLQFVLQKYGEEGDDPKTIKRKEDMITLFITNYRLKIQTRLKDLKGFQQYLEHTTLKRSVQGALFSDAEIQYFRTFDIQTLYYEIKTTKAGFQILLKNNGEQALIPDQPELAKAWDTRWGNYWFLDIISFFDFYLVIRSAKSPTEINDTKFLSVFNSIYTVLCKIRATIKTPISNPTLFLWTHISKCIKKTEDSTTTNADCPAPYYDYRRSFYFLYFWLLTTPGFADTYSTIETEMVAANIKLNGLDSFYRYLAYPGNELLLTARPFCNENEKSKPMGICYGINFLQGLMDFIESHSNSHEVLNEFTQKALADVTSAANAVFYRPFILDAFIALTKIQKENYEDNIRVALRRYKVFIAAELSKADTYYWDYPFSFETGDELYAYFLPIMNSVRSTTLDVAKVNAKLASFDLNSLAINESVVIHSVLEFFTRYANEANLKKICDFVISKKIVEQFLSYKVKGAGSFERTLDGDMTQFDSYVTLYIKKAKRFVEFDSSGIKMYYGSLKGIKINTTLKLDVKITDITYTEESNKRDAKKVAFGGKKNGAKRQI